MKLKSPDHRKQWDIVIAAAATRGRAHPINAFGLCKPEAVRIRSGAKNVAMFNKSRDDYGVNGEAIRSGLTTWCGSPEPAGEAEGRPGNLLSNRTARQSSARENAKPVLRARPFI